MEILDRTYTNPEVGLSPAFCDACLDALSRAGAYRFVHIAEPSIDHVREQSKRLLTKYEPLHRKLAE